MTSLPYPPTLVFYRRDRCAICDEARLTLQEVLEDRARAGDRVPRVRFVDIDADAALAERYGGLVPVLALNDLEVPLLSGYRQIAAFLDRALGRLA